MKKKNKINGVDESAKSAAKTSASHALEVTSNTEAITPKPITPEERKKLFQAYSKANARVEAARVDFEKAQAERGKFVKEIAEHCGKGPFNYEGQILTAVSRTSKDSGAVVWFFRSPGTLEIQEI